MIQIIRNSLTACGAIVVALYLLGAANIGNFALCYGVHHNETYMCVERGQ